MESPKEWLTTRQYTGPYALQELHQWPTTPSKCHPFIYAEDLYITTQKESFHKIESDLESALQEMSTYYNNNHLKSNLSKTQLYSFHLKTKTQEAVQVTMSHLWKSDNALQCRPQDLAEPTTSAVSCTRYWQNDVSDCKGLEEEEFTCFSKIFSVTSPLSRILVNLWSSFAGLLVFCTTWPACSSRSKTQGSPWGQSIAHPCLRDCFVVAKTLLFWHLDFVDVNLPYSFQLAFLKRLMEHNWPVVWLLSPSPHLYRGTRLFSWLLRSFLVAICGWATILKNSWILKTLIPMNVCASEFAVCSPLQIWHNVIYVLLVLTIIIMSEYQSSAL